MRPQSDSLFIRLFSRFFRLTVEPANVGNETAALRLAAFVVSIPRTVEEQTAIATILSDLDAELAALETKLTKARQLKQGMMQELLTGRIRLV